MAAVAYLFDHKEQYSALSKIQCLTENNLTTEAALEQILTTASQGNQKAQQLGFFAKVTVELSSRRETHTIYSPIMLALLATPTFKRAANGLILHTRIVGSLKNTQRK